MIQSTKITYRVLITGRVQGVCYRDWAKLKANELRIAGWVRNREAGSVEAVISGPGENVEKMLLALKIGPEAAKVNSIETFPHPQPQGQSFYRLSTFQSIENNSGLIAMPK